MPTGPQPVLPPSQGYPTGTYPTAGTWGYPVTPASPATSGRVTPTVASISPTTKQINTGAFELTVRGSNFTAESVVTIATVDQPTDLVDASTLIARTTSQGATAGGKAVTVTNAGVIATPGATFTYTP
jgi:hypothetical protein